MKKVLLAIALLAGLLAALAFWAWHSLGFLAGFAIEQLAPRVLGVEVQVGEASVIPREGLGRLRGVTIGNPPGFSSARAARFGTVRVAVDTLTVLDPVVLVREIAIESPEITFERGAGGSNLDAIQRNIQGRVKQAGAAPGPAAAIPGAERRYVIERFALRGARVTMTNPGLKGQGITFTLPDIELRDLGKRQNGITASEAANIVATTLITRIAQRLLTNLEALRQGGAQGALDALKGLLK